MFSQEDETLMGKKEEKPKPTEEIQQKPESHVKALAWCIPEARFLREKWH
jgi:hypothetical protein